MLVNMKTVRGQRRGFELMEHSLSPCHCVGMGMKRAVIPSLHHSKGPEPEEVVQKQELSSFPETENPWGMLYMGSSTDNMY